MKDGPHGKRGKWSQAGVPHKGWECVGEEDLGAPDHTCDMCESQSVRFVHDMRHPNYPHDLRCGCVCAGHMEGDLVGARKREARLRNTAQKREVWPSRKGWRRTAKGGKFIKANGWKVTIFPKGQSWSAVISNDLLNYKGFSNRSYPTIEEAQIAAFDGIVAQQKATTGKVYSKP